MDDGVDLLDAHLRSLRYTVSAAARALRGADPGRLEAQCSSIDAGVGGLGRLRDDFVRLIDGALGAERPGAPADDARSARGHDLVSSLLGAALEEEADEDGDAVEEIPLRKKSGGGDDVEELRPAAPATYDRFRENGADGAAGVARAPRAAARADGERTFSRSTTGRRQARQGHGRAGRAAAAAEERRVRRAAIGQVHLPEDSHAGPLQRQRNKSTMSREQRRISELHAELQDMGLQIVGATWEPLPRAEASPAATPRTAALRAATVQAADNRALVDSERISGFMADEGGYKDLQEPALGLRAGRVFQQNPIASPAAGSRSSVATGGAIPHAERKEVKCAGERALEKHVITFKMRIRAVYEDAGLPTGAKARVVGLLDKLGRRAGAADLLSVGDTEEYLRIEGDPFNGWCGMRLLSPTEEAVQYFDLMITAALIYVFASLPLCLAFEEINERLYYVNFFCDLFFCLDVVKNLHMGYQDATGTLVMDRSRALLHYCKTWLLIDTVSSVPVAQLLELADESSDNKILSSKKALKVLKLARMTKLVKLLRASQLVKKVRNVARELLEYYQVHVSDTTMKLLRLFVAMLLLTHWGSCMLILLVRTYNYPRLSWAVLWELLEAGSGRPVVSVSHAYSWGCYKTLLLVVGQGYLDFPSGQACHTTTGWCLIESWTTLVGMFLGCIFNAYAVASFTAMIVASNVSTQEFEEQLLRTNEYMRSLHLPSELRDRIREYYHHRWHEGKIFDETLILERLNPELCMEILAYKIRELVPKVPILRTASKRFSELLAKSMDPQVYVEGECVVSEGERGDTLYFIDKGLCEILVAAVANEVVRVLGDGCFFGEGAVILKLKRTATIRSKHIMSLYCVKAEDFENTIAEYPDVSSYVERIAKRRVERIQQLHINARLSNGTELMDAEDDEDVRTPLFRAANTRAHNLGRTTKMHETPAVPLGHMGKTAAFNRFKTAMLGVAPGAK
ncbi:voltage-gated potassium channel [Aureococcus anophagefferens]|nr:voltage-gated potassium channel [Aureococcus anophagefferens]